MGIDRRKFFKLTAASGATVSLAGCGDAGNELIRFIPEEDFVPGVAVSRPSICPLCPAGCGVEVRVMDGDVEVTRDGVPGVMKRELAKKLEGNPRHPVNRGKLCARGQAAIQDTYHPDRITQPLVRTGERGAGVFEPISWDEALGQLIGRLDALRAAGRAQALGLLTRPLRGQKAVLVRQFLQRFGALPPIAFEVFSDAVLRRANELSFGYPQLPTFDLGRSNYVLGFGADFLGTWNSPVAQNIAYGQMRQGRVGQRGKFVHVEARMSQTGANADEWVAAFPGTEGALALGLAHVIVNEGLLAPQDAGSAGRLIGSWSEGLPEYTPTNVADRTGVPSDRIERMAREFAGLQPAVAIVGGAPLAHTNALATALAVNALNALVGSVGSAGGVYFTPLPATAAGPGTAIEATSVEDFAAELLAGPVCPVEVLLTNDTNPAFGAPQAWRVSEALSRIPYIASFARFIDETSVLADLILPDHSFLESWVEDVPEAGSITSVASVASPVMRPLYETRAMPDVLLQVGKRLDEPLEPAFPWETYEAMIEAAFETLPGSETAADTWTRALADGVWSGQGRPGSASRVAPGGSPQDWVPPEFSGDPTAFPFHFLPYASQAFLDGSLAHLPWLQELPDVLSTAMWSCWVEINPQTAAELGIQDGDMVEVVSGQGTVEAPALISPGIAPDVIAMPVGQGHENYTRYASGRGSNPLRILASLSEPQTQALAWAATRVRVTRVREGRGELIRFAGAMREPEYPR
jgi:anaerobic selenocysteine-containing dehydrogenase